MNADANVSLNLTTPLQGAATLALITGLILLVTYQYLRRLPTPMPGLGWWTLALVPFCLRALMLSRSNGIDPTLDIVIGTSVQVTIISFYLMGARAYAGLKTPPLLVVFLLVPPLGWIVLGQVGLGLSFFAFHAPLTAYICAMAFYISHLFWTARREEANPGLFFASICFFVWALQRATFPIFGQQENLQTLHLLVNHSLFLALVLSLVIVTFHRMEMRLRRSQQVLHENARQMESIVLSSPVPMVAIDPKTHHVLFSNPPADTRFPLAGDAGTPRTAETMLDSATGARFLQLLESDLHIETFEARLHTSDGTPCWAVMNSVPLDYANREAALVTIHDITDRKQVEVDLQRQATTDELTGIFNRRHFLSMTTKELQRAQRYDSPISVIVMDLDRFKTVNDTYGHTAGDKVLKSFARTCLSPLRTNDVLGRIGGEEFAITLPEATQEAATEVAERLRQTFEATPVDIGGETIYCTLSAGVAQYRRDDETIDDLLKRADRALYEAKRAGRNRVKMG